MVNKSIEYKPISNLHFDPDNPRIPTTRQKDEDSKIIDYMIIKENLFDIVGSIGDQGYFPGEPLLVVPAHEAGQGHFIVVEGNRRLAALKLLNDFSLATVRKNAVAQLLDKVYAEIPKEAPVIVFDEREELLDYLGYRHITGVDQWDSLAKARFLTQLKDVHKSNFSDERDLLKHLAKLIGSTTNYVRKLLVGFQLYKEIDDNDFYGMNYLNEEEFSFSLLTTAVSYNNISDFVGVKIEDGEVIFESEKLRKLTEYIYKRVDGDKPRIPESRSLKVFNAVVASKDAYAIFESGSSLEEAEVFTDGPQKAFEKLLNDAYQSLKTSNDIFHKIRTFENSKFAKNRIEDIINIAEGLEILILKKTKKGFRK